MLRYLCSRGPCAYASGPAWDVFLPRQATSASRHGQYRRTGIKADLPGPPPSRSLSQAFGQDSTQDEVFEYAAKPIIDAVLDGYNGEGARGSACH